MAANHATMAEVSSCDREHTACKTEIASYLAFYRKSLPTSALDH